MWAERKWRGSSGIDRLEALLVRCEETPTREQRDHGRNDEDDRAEPHRTGRKHCDTSDVRARPEREDKGRDRQTIRGGSKHAESRTTTSATLRLPDHAHIRQRNHFFLPGGVAQTRQTTRHDLAIRHTRERASQERKTSREGSERIPAKEVWNNKRTTTGEAKQIEDGSSSGTTKAHSLCWRRRNNC